MTYPKHLADFYDNGREKFPEGHEYRTPAPETKTISTMKERPILFRTPMVQAIMEGRKKMTRRTKGLEIINENPDRFIWCKEYNQMDIPRQAKKYDTDFYYAFELKHNNDPLWVLTCPYGKPGDVLWVREKWKKNNMPMGWPYHYYAGNDTFTKPDAERWKPSIHMPKEACRIKLLIKSIRVERLQDIHEDDCRAEGIEKNPFGYYRNYLNDETATPLISFQTLWQSINGPESWEDNPWVWVIEFEKL